MFAHLAPLLALANASPVAAARDQERAASGQAEVDRLGPRLADVAQRGGLTPERLRIYLDFKGCTVTGTVWKDSCMGASCHELPYDENGDTSMFTTIEKGTIRNVWQRVSEDYAPLDVDVTTEEPPASAITRLGGGDNVFGTVVVFTRDSSRCPTGNRIECGSCGGVAYVDVFGYDAYRPGLVFNIRAKGAGEAGTHEIGHNASLYHDGVSGRSASDGDHGPCAPVTGDGYSKPVVQWSKGEYTNGGNAEDDLAKIAANAAPRRSAPTTTATAPARPPPSPGSPAAGIISTRTEVDAFAPTWAGDTFAITAKPAPAALSLDIQMEVRESGGRGALVASRPRPATPAVSFTATSARRTAR